MPRFFEKSNDTDDPRTTPPTIWPRRRSSAGRQGTSVNSFDFSITANLPLASRNGRRYQRYNVFVRRGFHKLMEEAGMVTEITEAGQTKLVRRYTPYSLRHFFASMLIEKNRSLKYIQTVMGHENIKMTFDVYGHIIRKKETDELDGEGGILGYVSTDSCGESVATTL